MSGNLVVRMLAVIVLVAAGIRLIYELLEPVAVWLLVALIVFAIVRVVGWYRGRW